MFLNPSILLEQVRIPLGARAADFGTGSGQYAFLVSDRVGEDGVVYALDAHVPTVDALSREASRQKRRVYTLHSDLNNHIPLKDNLLQFGVAANVLHQIADRKRFVNELARVIAPEGQVLVVDWAASFNNMGPTSEAALSPGDAVRLFHNAGFTTGEMLPAGTHHFAFVATGHTP